MLFEQSGFHGRDVCVCVVPPAFTRFVQFVLLRTDLSWTGTRPVCGVCVWCVCARAPVRVLSVSVYALEDRQSEQRKGSASL